MTTYISPKNSSSSSSFRLCLLNFVDSDLCCVLTVSATDTKGCVSVTDLIAVVVGGWVCWLEGGREEGREGGGALKLVR